MGGSGCHEHQLWYIEQDDAVTIYNYLQKKNSNKKDIRKKKKKCSVRLVIWLSPVWGPLHRWIFQAY